MSYEPPSPSASSVLLPFLTTRSRRGSLASITSRRELDRDALAEALDHIHGAASKSDALTSFHDFDGGSGKGGAGAKDLVSSGMSSLYNRLKSSVGQGPSPRRTDNRPGSRSGPDSPYSRAVSGRDIPVGDRLQKSRLSSREDAIQNLDASKRSNPSGVRLSATPDASLRSPQLPPFQEATRDSSSDSEAVQLRDRTSAQMPPVKSSKRLSGAPSQTSSTSQSKEFPSVLPNAPARALQYSETSMQPSSTSPSLASSVRPITGETAQPMSRTSSQLTARSNASTAKQAPAQRPSMVHVGVSHLPGFQPSEVSSPVVEDAPTLPLIQLLTSSQTLEPSPNINSALQRRRTGLRQDNSSTHSKGLPSHLKRRVISKEFWMKDENAKVCFDCGQSFSTFRRKHHCRTCGQIFDAKCTSLVSGIPFGQTGTLRLCKPCEDIIFGSNNDDDDSSIYTDDADDAARRQSLIFDDDMTPPNGVDVAALEQNGAATPTIGIPASRRNREAKRRSAVIEFDAHPTLARPTSSRSLVSLTGRPRPASHKRHASRAQLFRSSKSPEDDAPFPQQRDDGGAGRRASLSVFHNDNIIDPDLAAYLSDDDSEDEAQSNILATLNGDTHADMHGREKFGLSTLLSPIDRRSRVKSKDRLRDDDNESIMSKTTSRQGRRGAPSISSINTTKASPRHSRSSRHLRESAFDDKYDGFGSSLSATNSDCLKMERSAKMQDCNAHSFEINQASYDHIRKVLVQLLSDAKIQEIDAWEKALLPMLLRCTNDVHPDVPRGDDMDIRHYIKLKKVPGGRPGDTSYVSGVAFSKQVALKSMARSIRNPRIAIVTFPIEYSRHQSHFMSLEPVIAQEQEYLSNLVNRIAALRPQVLLVQRNVSGVALKLLDQAGITVAFNIKESVLAAVARVTRTTMIKSIDKLTIDPHHLGRCEGFSVKTYVHNNVRRTYIVLSGAQSDLGCTIILRGAETSILRTIKRVTEFMCFVVYNLRLETHLLRDEFVSIPSTLVDQLAKDPNSMESSTAIQVDADSNSEYAATERRAQSRILSVSPFVVFMQPYLLTQLRATEQRLANISSLQSIYAAVEEKTDNVTDDPGHFELVQPEMVRNTPSEQQPKAVREYLYAVHSAQYDRTAVTFDHQRKLWQGFLANNLDPFDPSSHQTIVVLHSTVSSVTSAPCVGPELLGIGFYAGFNRADAELEEDCTLGQYVEDVCLGAGNTCKECTRKMLDHSRQYVHGSGQLTVSASRQSSKLPGMNNVILMWSTCKLCQAETPVLPMSDYTWKYSFAKYLELSFWSRPLRARAKMCDHDLHRDYVRCFGFQDLVVKVQYDPIEIYDVVVPRPTIAWNVESDLIVKNAQYQLFEKRLNTFVESVRKRLSTINVDTLDEKQMLQAQEQIESLRERVEDDHSELLAKLQNKYSSSRYYELTPLNRALRFMDEKALWWDETFNNFEKDYFPSETDIRKLAAAQLKEMFYGSQSTTDSMISEFSDDEEGGSEMVALPPRPLSQQLEGDIVDTEKSGPTSTDKKSGTIGVASHDGKAAHSGQEDNLNEKTNYDSSMPPAVINIDKQNKDPRQFIAADDQKIQPTRLDIASAGSALINHVEQIRGVKESEKDDGTPTVDSKIPRLQTAKRKDDMSSTTETPANSRAQSQLPQSARFGPTSTSSQDRTASSIVNSETPSLERRLQDRIARLSSKLGAFPPSLIPRSIPTKSENGTANTVSSLAKHFEHLSREFEKERLRERRLRAAKSRQARANPLASSRPVVTVYNNATEAVGEPKVDHKDQQSSQEQSVAEQPIGDVASDLPTSRAQENEVKSQHSPSASFVQKGHLEGGSPEATQGDTNSLAQESLPVGSQTDTTASAMSISGESELDLHAELDIPDHKRNVWFKVLAEFWSKRSASGWANLDYPLHGTEHVFEDSDIIVREDEPSSVIALSLASGDYLNKVKDFRSYAASGRKHAQATDQGAQEIDEAIEASLLKDTGTHMKYSFSHGQVKASCKIFYAEAFDALRRRCGVANRFVESMSRCMKYDSKGGKTKSLFLKSLDNRFIIKSLQEVEVKAFTKFAPDYFAFMSHTLFRGLPSVIAKMFGLFQVFVKNPATGLEFSYYLLVMENLFYDHTPNRRFDLKGSMRNRKIESTGQPDEVLLDENLVETIFESPLFVREHSRRLIQASVWNDTLWLCKQNVMDYSLMAGFEDDARQLVVGIIDCIRTYTWDKKLESWIKDRGKNKPTITSPKDYRNRFRVSMMQYVLQAPNCWHQFQASMAPPKTLKEKDDAVPD